MAQKRHVNYVLRPPVIDAAKPKDKPYSLTDGGGLFVEVMPGGSKVWRYKYHRAGKREKVTLGPYPALSIKDARDRHEELRSQLVKGDSPAKVKRETERAVRQAEANATSFQEFAERWVRETLFYRSESYRAQIVRWLDSYVFPVIGSRSLGEVTKQDVLRILEDRRDTPVTADRTLDTTAQARRALQSRDLVERQRLERLDQRVAGRLRQERSRRQALTLSRQRCQAVLAEAGEVRRAEGRLPLAQRVQALRSALTEACREQTHALTRCQGTVRLAEQRVAGIEQEAGRAALKAEELARRFGLTGEVPCVGTDLQGRCKLLGDAREAQALIPSARAQLARLAVEKSAAQQELLAARQRCEALAGAPQNLARAERREAVARERVSRLAVMCSKAPACAQARMTLVEIEQELQALGPAVAADATATSANESADERAERQQIAEARQAVEEQLQQQARQASAALARLDHALASLPPAFDERQVTQASRALGAAREAFGATEQSMLTAVREAQTVEEVSKQVVALAERRERVRARSVRVEDELGNWNLFARCMSNDGLIALAIDDAGPALSALANDLLLACYGPRFTVSIHTLLETAKGEQKEGFDIVVHDGDTGESKSVSMMSGGERTFVESCLTRAIALYLAQNTGRHYTTLFTDEADGALDSQRKRMFMAMKREMLRLGGYEREFFVSQTPELTAMADAVIDLDALKAHGCEAQRPVSAA